MRLSPARIDDEIARAHDAIANVAGTAPIGFRAPGYEISPVVLAALLRHGYRYDSSVFPAVPFELPITVLPWLRIPVIGIALVLAPEPVRDRLVTAARAQPFFNLEPHGIDLADADEDGLPGALVARQPELRRPLHKKLAALDATLHEARHSVRASCRLAKLRLRLSPRAQRLARFWSSSRRPPWVAGQLRIAR